MFGHFTTFIMHERVNDLHNLNILLYEYKMSFKIGSLTCEIYWETANSSPSASPTFCGKQSSAPNFEKGGGRKKMSA